jgi:hypothetical protein
MEVVGESGRFRHENTGSRLGRPTGIGRGERKSKKGVVASDTNVIL